MTDRMLGGRTPAAFLREVWQREPLLVRGALADAPAPLDRDDLIALSTEPEVESRLVLQRGPDWEVEHGPFELERLDALPDEGWSLLVHGVDRWIDAAAELLERFRFLPNWRLDDLMVSLAPPGGSVGAHVDRYDVFLIQAAGRRRWQIETKPRDDGPSAEGGEALHLLDRFEPTASWRVEPGDLIYLPPGFPHHGVAIDESLTLSVGFRAPSASDVVGAWAAELVEQPRERPAWRDGRLDPTAHPGEITDGAVERLDAWLAEAAADTELRERAIGTLLTRGRDVLDEPAEDEPVEADAWRGALADGGSLRRLAVGRFAFRRRGDGSVWLFVGGRCYNAPAGDAAFVETLCGRDRLDARTLGPWLDSQVWGPRLDEWVLRGELLLADPEDDPTTD